MSDYGDNWREKRRRDQEHRRKHSQYCYGCRERKVWDDEQECPSCGTPNPNFKQPAKS